MAENPQKPKRDLRARLGRTITPKTGGAAEAPEAPDVGAAAVAPVVAEVAAPMAEVSAPVAAAGPAAAKPAPRQLKKAPAPRAPGGGIAAPPAGIAAPPFGATPDVAPPPFGRPPEPELPSDPFAAAAGAQLQQQVVRLEFDDKLVTDQEVGKSARSRIYIVAAIVLVVGAAIGWGAGAMLERRALFAATVRDAQSIYGSINGASSTVNAAQTHINAVIASAGGNVTEGVLPAVNYEAIQALQALQKPFDANAFTGKNYNAFTPDTVHDLITYTANIDRLWHEFRVLVAETLAEARRAELDRTARETAEGASTLYGAVLQRSEDGSEIVGTLAFLQIEEGPNGARVMGRLTRSGAAREFQPYNAAEGQEIASAQAFVIRVDGAASRGVLAEQTGAFGRYLQRVRDLKLLIDATVEIQGRLLQAIARALSEAGANTTASE